MFYAFINSLLQPYTALMLLLGVWILWIRRRSGESRRLWRIGACLYAMLYVASTPAFAQVLMGAIEGGLERTTPTPRISDVIVVLTGSFKRADSVRPFDELADSSLYRCVHAARVYRLRPCPVIVAGGKVDPNLPGRACSEVMQECLVDLGVSAADITIEKKSRATDESARKVQEILAARGESQIILVTEAYHMRRSMAAFRAEGLDVTPAPCMFRCGEFRWAVHSFLPNSGAMLQVELAAHELLGRIWYLVKSR